LKQVAFERGVWGSVMRRGVWSLAAVMILAGAIVAHAKKKAPEGPPPDLPGHVNYLTKQLYGLMLDESDALTGQIQDLVMNHLQQWIPRRVPTDVETRREMEMAFSQLHYPYSGQPAAFVQPWNGKTIVGAGYTLGWTEFEKVNSVALFVCEPGTTRLAAVTHFVPRADLHYEMVPEQNPQVFRFFIYGFKSGKSQPRLAAALYSFDGKDLKQQWLIQDLFDGKFDIQQNKVVIRYIKEDEYVREVAHRRKPARYESIYAITPTGVNLETEKQVPY
jgi:hypothetical protein